METFYAALSFVPTCNGHLKLQKILRLHIDYILTKNRKTIQFNT